jgi:3-deoxy-manno-octulosonate cytidylyltransferase (CMP-KDO synthetase)
MRAIGIVPARMASARFPGKPLVPIAGKPMLWYVWRAAVESLLLEPVFVATADADIMEWCELAGAKFLLTRADCRNGTERCHDAMRQLAQRDRDEIVVNIQGDEPTIQPDMLDALARAFYDPTVKIASLCFRPSGPEFASNPNRVKVLVGPDKDALGFYRSIHLTHLWRAYHQHIGVYAYRREILAQIAGLDAPGTLEQVAWMNAGYPIRMVEVEGETIAVDRPEDIIEVEKFLHG